MTNFEKYTNEELRQFFWMWVNILPTQSLYPEGTYEKALLEAKSRCLKIDYIED